MDVIIFHNDSEWRVLPESLEYTLSVFRSSLEAKLFVDQNGYNVIKKECESNCLICKK
jgi:beta-glucosidase/6-phospho-beta-glucosidase/beta-galactosidase